MKSQPAGPYQAGRSWTRPKTVGTLRGSLGISVLAELRTPNRFFESSPLFIECWFNKRLPPVPALQAGFQFEC